ncbi:hypothetical protein TNCV_2818301 [Trichonephila clavipes]|nr:hypothetical protein TNCV_2818301 [Trichonephila clavipes]
MVNLLWRDPRLTNGIGILKSVENPSKTMNALDDFPLDETLKMLRWSQNVFEKIIAKHLRKSLRLHTFPRRWLREAIRRKWL